ncbi:MAG: YdeI/OmpD-associated family protein [Bacteroidota bacterium]
MNTFTPKNQADWRNWLAENHVKEDSIWIIFYKKSSPQHNLSWSEAVDQALCFGWIDSTRRTIDGKKYQQYFCKRKPKSNWSKVNKEKIEVLIAEGLMEEAGYKSMEIAKANGSWTLLDKIEALEVPEELEQALAAHPGATAYFEGLSKSNKKILLHWVISAKRPETRQKRASEVAVNAAQQTKPKQFRR